MQHSTQAARRHSRSLLSAGVQPHQADHSRSSTRSNPLLAAASIEPPLAPEGRSSVGSRCVEHHLQQQHKGTTALSQGTARWPYCRVQHAAHTNPPCCLHHHTSQVTMASLAVQHANTRLKREAQGTPCRTALAAQTMPQHMLLLAWCRLEQQLNMLAGLSHPPSHTPTRTTQVHPSISQCLMTARKSTRESGALVEKPSRKTVLPNPAEA